VLRTPSSREVIWFTCALCPPCRPQPPASAPCLCPVFACTAHGRPSSRSSAAAMQPAVTATHCRCHQDTHPLHIPAAPAEC
jgi:hypothetical protein